MNCNCSNCSHRNKVFNANEDTKLHRLIMCRKGKPSSIGKLLHRENLNARDAHYDTPLHLAAMNKNDSEILVQLINAGAEINARNLVKNTPLHVAAIHLNRRAVELLLQSGADVNCRNFVGNTPLHLSVKSSLYSRSELYDKLIVEKLIEAGADVNLTNSLNETPLFRAVEVGCYDAVQELLKSGADVNICNSDFSSCLHKALCKLHPDQTLVKELVRNGANVNCEDNWFRTPLDLAILRYLNDPSDELKTAMALIKIGVLVNPEISIDMCRLGQETVTDRLHEFHKACASAVKQMKVLRITDTISLHDFAFSGISCTVSSSNKLVDKIYLKVLQTLLLGNFELYEDIIGGYFPKLYLREVLMSIRIVSNIKASRKEIKLVSDVVWSICDYLNPTDMFRLIKASSIVESDILS